MEILRSLPSTLVVLLLFFLQNVDADTGIVSLVVLSTWWIWVIVAVVLAGIIGSIVACCVCCCRPTSRGTIIQPAPAAMVITMQNQSTMQQQSYPYGNPGMVGYNAPPPYGQAQPQYGQAQPQYGQAQPQYGQTQSHYGQPAPDYTSPESSKGYPDGGVAPTPALPPIMP